MSAALDGVEVSVGARDEDASQDASVVWLHGLGADGHDFEPIVPELGLPRTKTVRFVFPHAPVRPVTINGGVPMRAWFDILSLDRSAPQDEAGIRDSEARVRGLIERENARGVPAGRIVLAGFSQGAAVALHTALRYPERLAGVVALSCYLPMRAALESGAHPANRGLPIFQAHGLMDPMLPLPLGEEARATLEAMGHPVSWHTYPMPHAVCPQEIADVARFLSEVLELER